MCLVKGAGLHILTQPLLESRETFSHYDTPVTRHFTAHRQKQRFGAVFLLACSGCLFRLKKHVQKRSPLPSERKESS